MTEDGSRPDLPLTVEGELTPAEQNEVAQRLRPSSKILHEAVRTEGELDLHRTPAALAWSALAAGLSMGFSLLSMGILRSSLPDVAWRPLVVNLGYTVGFLIVILGRQQLFTEKTLTPVLPLLHNRDLPTLLRLLRLWGIVLVGNLIGALVFALVAGSGAIFAGLHDSFRELSLEAMQGSFGSHLLRAIYSGWLVALIVWLLPGADTSRVFIIVLLSYIIGCARLSHVIAGSVEALYGVVAGATSVGAYVTDFLLPTLLGNLIGGMSLVAAFTHGEVAAEAGRPR
jgi:formate/nitrite transporter FocA (FNT family)